MMVNLDKIVAYRDTPSCIKLLVEQAKAKGVITVGSVLKELPSFDLLGMIKSGIALTQSLVDDVDPEDLSFKRKNSIDSFLLMSNLIAFFEGGEFTSQIEEIIPRVQYLKLLLGLEMVARAAPDNLTLDYSRMTLLGPIPKNDPPIVKIKDESLIPEVNRKILLETETLLRQKFVFTKDELEELKNDFPEAFDNGKKVYNASLLFGAPGSGRSSEEGVPDHVPEEFKVNQKPKKLQNPANDLGSQNPTPTPEKKEPPADLTSWL